MSFDLKSKNVLVHALASLLLICSVASCAVDTKNQDSKSMDENQSLAGTSWWVEDISGRGVIDMTHTTIEFDADGRVSGDTGCNRYFGSVEFTGPEISFGPLAGTRKACAASLMDQEMNFFKAMEKISQWEVAETGLLHLMDEQSTTLLRASETDN
jgi:heat shock protein HslJ